MVLQFGDIWRNWPLLMQGAINTCIFMACCGLLGLLVGVACGEARRNGPKALQWGIAAYVEAIRDTPFIVQLFFIYFGLPAFGLRLDAWTAAGIAMVLNLGAYFTEIIRAGLEATHRGQIEAGRALGLSSWLIFVKIVLPPALAKVYGPLVSQFVLVFLGSAVISQISAEDLAFQGQFIQSRTFRAFEVYFVITALYVGMALAIKTGLLRLKPVFFPWRGER